MTLKVNLLMEQIQFAMKKREIESHREGSLQSPPVSSSSLASRLGCTCPC